MRYAEHSEEYEEAVEQFGDRVAEDPKRLADVLYELVYDAEPEKVEWVDGIPDLYGANAATLLLGIVRSSGLARAKFAAKLAELINERVYQLGEEELEKAIKKYAEAA